MGQKWFILGTLEAEKSIFEKVGKSSFGALAQVWGTGIDLLVNRLIPCSYLLVNNRAKAERINGRVNNQLLSDRKMTA